VSETIHGSRERSTSRSSVSSVNGTTEDADTVVTANAEINTIASRIVRDTIVVVDVVDATAEICIRTNQSINQSILRTQ
jgi:hypothetical protein